MENHSPDISGDVSAGIVNFNGMDVLADTIRAVQTSKHPVREILVADNGSTDGSLEWLHGMRSGLRCVELGRNAGSAAARNALIEAASSEYVMLLDNDVVIEPGTIGRLLDVMRARPEAGVCHPEIEDPSDPDAYHYNGGWIHYLGALVARERPAPGASNSHYGVRPPRPRVARDKPCACQAFGMVAGEHDWGKTQAFAPNRPFLPHEAAGDISHNENS